MTSTPVTDYVINRLSSFCKKAGYSAPTAKQIKLRKAAELVEDAKERIIAREFEKYAYYKRELNKRAKASQKRAYVRPSSARPSSARPSSARPSSARPSSAVPHVPMLSHPRTGGATTAAGSPPAGFPFDTRSAAELAAQSPERFAREAGLETEKPVLDAVPTGTHVPIRRLTHHPGAQRGASWKDRLSFIFPYLTR